MAVLGTNVLITRFGLMSVADAWKYADPVLVSTGLMWLPMQFKQIVVPNSVALYRLTLSNGYSIDVTEDQRLPTALGDMSVHQHLNQADTIENTALQPAFYVPPVKATSPSIRRYGEQIPHVNVGYHDDDELLLRLVSERTSLAAYLLEYFKELTEESLWEFVGRMCSVVGYWHITKNLTIGCRVRVPDKESAQVLASVLARLNLPFEVCYSKKVFTSSKGLDLMNQGQAWGTLPFSYYVTLRKFDHRVIPLSVEPALRFFREQEHVRSLSQYHKMFRRNQLNGLRQEKSKLRVRYVEQIPHTGKLTHAYTPVSPASQVLIGSLHCLP